MLNKAQQFDKAERTLRQLFSEAIELTDGCPEMYGVMEQLAEIGKALQHHVKKHLESEDAQIELSIGAGI